MLLNQEWLSVMANITCLTVLSGNQVYPMSAAGTDTWHSQTSKVFMLSCFDRKSPSHSVSVFSRHDKL